MPLSTLKEKGQITLPSVIRKKIHATRGDMFDFEIQDDKIIMTPLSVTPATQKRIALDKKRDLSKWIGSSPGIFKSAQEVDDFIRKERDAWD